MPVFMMYESNTDNQFPYCTECDYITTCTSCRTSRCHDCNSPIDWHSEIDGTVVRRFQRRAELDFHPMVGLRLDDIGITRRNARRIGDLLREYYYTPDWEPRGEGNRHLGFELEVTCHDVEALQKAQTTAGPLCIWKHDGSVDGFEMVTHPMTYEWARDNFPWHMLPEMESDGCEIYPSDNGMHIHVSRSGFANDSQLYRWEKFMHRNRAHVNRIARRRNNNWARWTQESNDYYFADILARKYAKTAERFRQVHQRRIYGYADNGSESERAEYVRDAYRLRQMERRFTERERPERYSALNLTNDDTVEVRVFASTLQPVAAIAALGLVESTIRYAGDITSRDVITARGWHWEPYRAWLDDHAGEFEALVSVIDSAPRPTHASERF